MKLVPKTPLEIHRNLLASGVFQKETQKHIARELSVNQGTVSRIAAGQFKRVNKSVLAVCKYAGVNTVKTRDSKGFRSLLASRTRLSDPEKRKLADIIGLAVDLLEHS
jgi:transcriptional regulator with XRE-family HTH domain